MEFLISWLPEYAQDALIDSVKLVPFLFFIFLFIEIFEKYFSHKINSLTQYSKNVGPFIGALVAAIPQCGFSVIASTLYVQKLITRGTLIAVYVSTSDEAIPILLSDPSQASAIMPIIAVKVILAIAVGYFVDFVLKSTEPVVKDIYVDVHEEGCCQHDLAEGAMKNLLWHPVKHTFNIFVLILLVNLVLSFVLAKFGVENLGKVMLDNSPLQPIMASIVGLIPNCAISVLITMLYIKGTISFGSVIAGLTAGAGLGLVVLLKKNENIKDSLNIIMILLTVSMVVGLILQYII